MGQIFWYTLEGRDSLGNVTGGWDLEELRTIQDFYVKYGLSSAEGVSEVASIGGYVKEYQVDIDPDAMKANDVTLEQLTSAVKNSNLDVGAQTLEINRVEYFIRGLGYIKNLGDLEKTVVKVTDNVPIYIGDIAHVTFGPATRRGVLDKDGSEVVGGVVVTRFGANPMEVINNVKGKINELAPGLPIKTLSDGTQSQVTVIPFYDRTDLIKETIGTLQKALWLEILVTIIVIIVMVTNLRASILISGLLPVAVLMTFIAMRHFGVDANIVALSGIAIAIGTMVDMGIVLSENILRHLDKLKKGANKLEAIYTATTEVASAILTAIATTIVSFIPVFALEAAEGKMFRPLAFTKTFALVAAIIIAITVIPAFAHWLFSIRIKRRLISLVLNILLAIGGLVLLFIEEWMGVVVLVTALAGLISFFGKFLSRNIKRHAPVIQNLLYASIVAFLLTRGWMPLGVQNSLLVNFIFVLLVLGVLLGSFKGFIYLYPSILKWCLQYKWVFLALPVALVVSAIFIMRDTSREFMPSLDEGSFLLMPSSMLHSGMDENIEIIKKLDMAVG
ncbi:MAG: efflux RND transporter permease subunit, partial [Cyclobacteriaceae bacterium]|nr:efflux RND transporter permease subunit [Cyclobacteriaceae bacterium]